MARFKHSLRIAGMIVAVLGISGAGSRAMADEVAANDPAAIVDALNVTLLTEEYPPFNYHDDTGRLRGVGAEVVQAMAAHIGYSKHIESMPWKRVIQRMESEDNIGVFSMTRTPQREEQYRWVGPIVPTNAGIFRLANSPKSVTSTSDLREVGTIGVQAGGADEIALREYGFENLEPIHNPLGGVQMLGNGRIEFLVSSDIELFEQLRGSPLRREDIEMVYQFNSGDLYLAFSKHSADTVIEVWQAAYEIIVESGQFARIMEQYGVITGQVPLLSGSLGVSQ